MPPASSEGSGQNRSSRRARIRLAERGRYRNFKVREGRLGPETINKTLTRLAQILEVAVEYELIGRNPAAGKRRRLKATKPRPVHLDDRERDGADRLGSNGQ